jgi:hypothetical protein
MEVIASTRQNREGAIAFFLRRALFLSTQDSELMANKRARATRERRTVARSDGRAQGDSADEVQF